MTASDDLAGAPVDRLPTPALVVDLDALERNLERLPALLSDGPVRLRPHSKAHKCAEIARRQIALGAVGVCCQTISEAEALAGAGIDDILVTNQVLDPAKLARLATIPEGVRIGLCIDSIQGLNLAAQAKPKNPWDLYIEADVGGGRCGVTGPGEAVALARAIAGAGLRFAGLQAYNGRIQHVREASDRERSVEGTAAVTRAFVEALEEAGLPPSVVTGGGTGTVALDCRGGTLGEVQCGSYALMDADYLALQLPAEAAFEPALTVVASVISGRAAHIVVDAGLKALATDSGFPTARDHPQISYANPSDEHGVLRAADGRLPGVGSRIHLIPGHCDPTIALHERIYAARRGIVEEIWPTLARGIW